MTDKSKSDIASRSPTQVYTHPSVLMQDLTLSDQEKLAVLTTWKSEAEHIQRSENEGLDGGENSLLDAIELSIKSLTVKL